MSWQPAATDQRRHKASFPSDQLTEGEVTPSPVPRKLAHLRALIHKHPLISPQELMAVYDLTSLDEVKTLIQPLLDEQFIHITPVYQGWFIEKNS